VKHGKAPRYFQAVFRTFKQNSKTFQDNKKIQGLFQDVGTLKILANQHTESSNIQNSDESVGRLKRKTLVHSGYNVVKQTGIDSFCQRFSRVASLCFFKGDPVEQKIKHFKI